jgi:hypothetical protein
MRRSTVREDDGLQMQKSELPEGPVNPSDPVIF